MAARRAASSAVTEAANGGRTAGDGEGEADREAGPDDGETCRVAAAVAPEAD